MESVDILQAGSPKWIPATIVLFPNLLLIHTAKDKTIMFAVDHLEMSVPNTSKKSSENMVSGSSNEKKAGKIVGMLSEGSLRLTDKKRKTHLLVNFSNSNTRDSWKDAIKPAAAPTPPSSATSSFMPRAKSRHDPVSPNGSYRDPTPHAGL